MSDYFDIVTEGFEAAFAWFDTIKIGDFSVLQCGLFVLFLTLMWRFVLSPFFGISGGSLSISASDTVSRVKKVSKSNSKKKDSKED